MGVWGPHSNLWTILLKPEFIGKCVWQGHTFAVPACHWCTYSTLCPWANFGKLMYHTLKPSITEQHQHDGLLPRTSPHHSSIVDSVRISLLFSEITWLQLFFLHSHPTASNVINQCVSYMGTTFSVKRNTGALSLLPSFLVDNIQIIIEGMTSLPFSRFPWFPYICSCGEREELRKIWR